MKYSFLSARTDRETQKAACLLLGRVFPDYWEQIAMQNEGFPFEEISFAAKAENGVLCAHAGLMPFDVSDGKGGTLHFAGLASVAVDPAFRGEGLAAGLCEKAAEWARENGFDALPLFTGKFGVYAHHGWSHYEVDAPRLVLPKSSRHIVPVKASTLTGRGKAAVVYCYENSFDFPGKVKRTSGNAFHGWKRIFGEPEFEFLVTDRGYALVWGKAAVELCTEPGAELSILEALGAEPFTLALPAGHPVWAQIQAAGWKIEGVPEDVYHGERVMMRPLKTVPQGIYFPCADKF